MDLINYEIWIAYQKADLKVKSETFVSSYQKNRLYLHFLSYFTVEVKFSSAKTYLLRDSFAETEQFFLIKSVFFTELFTSSKHFFHI